MKKEGTEKFWDNEFKLKREWLAGINGEIQTSYFADITYSLLNPTLKKDIEKLEGKAIDYLCAFGQGTEMLKKLNFKEIIGIDDSKEAIKEATEKYSDIRFETNLDDSENNIDLIYSSNRLEHFHNPKEKLDKLLDISNNYVIIIVPFEQELTDIHLFKFEDKTFDSLIWDRPEWKIVQQTVIGSTDNFYNPTKQCLVVYKKIY